MMRYAKLLLTFLLLLHPPLMHAQAGGGMSVTVATVTLSPSQLLALRSSPVPLVAAPGTGFVVAPLSVAFQYKAGNAPYTIPVKGNLLIFESTPVNQVTSLRADGFLDRTTSAVFLSEGIGGVGPAPQSVLENAPLMVFNDSASEWTGGDGTLTITVYYTVLPLQ